MFGEVEEFASALQKGEQQKGISKCPLQQTAEKQPKSHLSTGKSVLRIIPLCQLRVWPLLPQHHEAVIIPTHKSINLGVGFNAQLNYNFIKHSTREHREQSQAALPSTAPCSAPAVWLRKPGMEQQNNQIPEHKPTAKVGATLKEAMGISLSRKTPPARGPGLDCNIRLINSMQSLSDMCDTLTRVRPPLPQDTHKFLQLHYAGPRDQGIRI